ncbi:MAG: hypothetical protein ACC631_07525, partial [Halocynthiibacter sp.]
KSSIKKGAWALKPIKALQANEGGAPSHRDGVHHLTAPSKAPPGAAFPVAAILFAEYFANAKNQLDPIPPETALSQLLLTGGRISRHSASIEPLANLLDTVPSYRLRYQCSEYAVSKALQCLNCQTD